MSSIEWNDRYSRPLISQRRDICMFCHKEKSWMLPRTFSEYPQEGRCTITWRDDFKRHQFFRNILKQNKQWIRKSNPYNEKKGKWNIKWQVCIFIPPIWMHSHVTPSSCAYHPLSISLCKYPPLTHPMCRNLPLTLPLCTYSASPAEPFQLIESWIIQLFSNFSNFNIHDPWNGDYPSRPFLFPPVQIIFSRYMHPVSCLNFTGGQIMTMGALEFLTLKLIIIATSNPLVKIGHKNVYSSSRSEPWTHKPYIFDDTTGPVLNKSQIIPFIIAYKY